MNTAIVTMALTPVVSGLVPALYERLWPRGRARRSRPSNIPATGLAEHVVIAGAGRVGPQHRRRAGAAAACRSCWSSPTIAACSRRGRPALPVIYGDASQPVVLEAAGLARARAILGDRSRVSRRARHRRAARQLRPDMPIIARADGADAVRALYALGIQEVTSPEFEAAIEMTRQALIYFNMPAHEVLSVASAIRRERYVQGGRDRAWR